MTVYVDDPMMFIRGRFRGYCHMWTDGTHDELDAFAVSIGLKKEWAQEKRGAIVKDFYHYDISPFYRERALLKGAHYMALGDYVRSHMGPPLVVLKR